VSHFYLKLYSIPVSKVLILAASAPSALIHTSLFFVLEFLIATIVIYDFIDNIKKVTSCKRTYNSALDNYYLKTHTLLHE